MNYYAIYDKSTFTYPNTSYGVMSWWDYGHLITYIAHRIPTQILSRQESQVLMGLLRISWQQMNRPQIRSSIMTGRGT